MGKYHNKEAAAHEPSQDGPAVLSHVDPYVKPIKVSCAILLFPIWNYRALEIYCSPDYSASIHALFLCYEYALRQDTVIIHMSALNLSIKPEDIGIFTSKKLLNKQ